MEDLTLRCNGEDMSVRGARLMSVLLSSARQSDCWSRTHGMLGSRPASSGVRYSGDAGLHRMKEDGDRNQSLKKRRSGVHWGPRQKYLRPIPSELVVCCRAHAEDSEGFERQE